MDMVLTGGGADSKGRQGEGICCGIKKEERG